MTLSSDRGGRMPWAELPPSVTAAVAAILGSPVVDARSQAGGYSPGSADRVLTASGRRAFVKTGWVELNAESCDIHRREAEITALLPGSLPVSRLIGVADLGDWVVLVLDEVDGHQAREPWDADELEAALDAYQLVGAVDIPPALGAMLDGAGSHVAHWAGAWSDGTLGARLAERHPDDGPAAAMPDDGPAVVMPGDGSADGLPHDLGPWLRRSVDTVAALAERAPAAVAGDRLVHFDGRADNVLIRPDGSAVIVDWPWALRGAPWVDAVALLMNVRLTDVALARGAAAHPVFDGMDPADADALLAAVAGGMLGRSVQPGPPGIPTLRAFQRRQGIVCLEWLRERWPG